MNEWQHVLGHTECAITHDYILDLHEHDEHDVIVFIFYFLP